MIKLSKKILIIDDSALMRRVISDIINLNSEYEVAAIAKDGLEGFDLIVSNPNLYSAIILDINMPKMNGLELLQKLQKNRIEQTVIVVSTVAKQGAKETILALEYGAFDFVTKPENYLDTKSEDFRKRIHEMLDVATNSRASIERTRISGSVRTTIPSATTKTADTRRVTSENRRSTQTKTTDAILELRKRTSQSNVSADKVKGEQYKGVKAGKKKLVALACSTGGPKSLQQVIPMIPQNLDAGIVLVQHMPQGFTLSLSQRLNELSALEVKEASDGDVIKKGCVYIAPGGRHMKIVKCGMNYTVKLSDEAAIDGLRPCANVMYESLVNSDFDEITCVVLTGMGADGTKGIKGLHDANKKLHIIAQDENSCVVYGMPKAIAQTGIVDEVLPLTSVAEAITKNVGVQ